MKSIAALVVVLVAATSCGGDDAERSMSSEEVAGAYFEALVTGNVARASELATVPFSRDGKKVLSTQEELSAFHAKVKSDKGDREVPTYAVQKHTEPATKKMQLDAEQFPAHDIFVVTITKDNGKTDGIALFVTKGDDPKVIGFVD